jgi:N-formylglutamate deformylase
MMFSDALPNYVNIRSPRVRMGLGTIARIVASGEEIYARKLRFAEARQRIETLYRPYHHALRRLVDDTSARFGGWLLVDCHSMPSNAGHRDERARPEFVLGDRYGTSCGDVVADVVEQTLRGQGYTVSRNKPYAGGFITEHHGNPAAGLHSIQLEINRALYMDERRYQRIPGFERVAADMDLLARRLGDIPLDELRPYRAAAAE